MPKSCSAFNCTSRYKSKNPEITFHRFPFSKPSVLKQWLDNIGRENFNPKKHMVVCSLHFTPECFSGFGNRKNLLWNAVPTLFTTFLPQDAKTIHKSLKSGFRSADNLVGIGSEKKCSFVEDAQRLERHKDAQPVSYINEESCCQTTKDLSAADHTYTILDPCRTKARLFDVLDANMWLQRRLQAKCKVIKRMKLKLQKAHGELLTLRRKVKGKCSQRYSSLCSMALRPSSRKHLLDVELI
ncbi:THAP domain-containing protein 3 isoform X2 [Triplophysa dalaica]|uniref:THAP domain-containing protein 3 isoform X2 n=1 Tax=Triplophysa dalaica TaxID=1582913 RepID=UPI0024E013D0|nr:THAP domain-containing protein 3 isoform X2 [Triplophysa dalaica]